MKDGWNMAAFLIGSILLIAAILLIGKWLISVV